MMAKHLRASAKFKIYKKVRHLLHSRYPDVFPYKGKRPALKVGIAKDLIADIGSEVSGNHLRIFLGIWTSSSAYLQSVSRGGKRICPKGNYAEIIDVRHITEAKEMLRNRRSKTQNMLTGADPQR